MQSADSIPVFSFPQTKIVICKETALTQGLLRHEKLNWQPSVTEWMKMQNFDDGDEETVFNMDSHIMVNAWSIT